MALFLEPVSGVCVRGPVSVKLLGDCQAVLLHSVMCVVDITCVHMYLCVCEFYLCLQRLAVSVLQAVVSLSEGGHVDTRHQLPVL